MIYGTIQGQKLELLYSLVAADTLDYLTGSFSFLSSDWEGLTKFVHFSKDDISYSAQLNEENKFTEDAHVNLSEGKWNVYLHGNKYENGQVIQRVTTNIAYLIVRKTGMLNDEPFPEVDPSVVEQLEAEIEDHETRITNLEEGGELNNSPVEIWDHDNVSKYTNRELVDLVRKHKLLLYQRNPILACKDEDYPSNSKIALYYISSHSTIIGADWVPSIYKIKVDGSKVIDNNFDSFDMQFISDKVIHMPENPTDNQYPSAKLVNDMINDLREELINRFS